MWARARDDKLRRVYDIRILLFMNVRRRFRVPIRARVIQYWRPKYNRRVHNADDRRRNATCRAADAGGDKGVHFRKKTFVFFLYKRVF